MVSTRRVSLGPLRPTPVVLVTLVVLTVVYVVTGLGRNYGGTAVTALISALPLEAPAVLQGEAWRLLTYGLLHNPEQPTHLLFNGITFYFFGRYLEERFGWLRFLAFIAGAVLAGGVAVVVGNVIGIAGPMCIGFSAACQACVIAWAMWNKNAPVLMFFAIPMKGLHMLILSIAMWILDAVSTSPISAAAHFGGIVFGFAVWFFVTRRNRLPLLFSDLLVKLHLKKAPRLTVVPKNDRWVN